MQFLAEILKNEPVAHQNYYMELYVPELAGQAVPGQFLHVRVGESLDPLLRRPLSLHQIDPKQSIIGLLYQVRGKGTEILSRKRAGEKIDVMGPLGKGFKLDFTGNHAVIVGGGIGVAPLYPLARELVLAGKTVTVLLGARFKEGLLAVKRFLDLGCLVEVATEDGGQGYKGYVTDILEEFLVSQKVDFVYSCGPEPMLAKVEESCIQRKIPGQVSLEAYMGCGVGACLSCACKMHDGARKKYAKVCTDGPVFAFGEVKISREY